MIWIFAAYCLLVSGIAIAHNVAVHKRYADLARRVNDLSDLVNQRPINRTTVGLTWMCEDALRIILQSNGGFPANTQGNSCRQLVRQIRAMYSEIEHPTTGPDIDDAASDEPEYPSYDYEDEVDEETD